MTQIKATTLYFTQGSSDKIYQTAINKVTTGYTVSFSYGRRGAALKSGIKTPAPVLLDKAEKIYESLLKAKQRKGYTQGEDGVAFSDVDCIQGHSGIFCQLLNPIDRTEAIRLCNDDNYCAQEKHDGERRLVKDSQGLIQAFNKKGLYVGLPDNLVGSMRKHTNFIVDSEDMGHELVLFDLLELDGRDLKSNSYRSRLQLLNEMSFTENIRVTKTEFSTKEKLDLLSELDNEDREGIVFKRLDAVYSSGRPNSGGDQLKYKFYETCSVVVSYLNAGKRSVGIHGFNGSQECALGNVTIPVNKCIPSVGQIIEVRYLYAFKDGCLYQPLFIDERTDMDYVDCSLDKIKFKPDYVA